MNPGPRILIDTQVLLWHQLTPQRLGPKAREALGSESTELFISMASLWEISIKYTIGKVSLPAPPAVCLPDALMRNGIEVLDILRPHVFAVTNLPMHHRDPFDRLIIAQAKIEGMPLLTSDSHFSAYGIQVIPAE